jgi:EmrB/QacA subfamily drug resistance transporter
LLEASQQGWTAARRDLETKGTTVTVTVTLVEERGQTQHATQARRDRARDRWLSLAAVCLGTMMTFLTITATVSSLAAIQQDLHASSTTLVWVPSAYTLLVASLVLTGGTLGDLFGRRRIFMGGALVMAVGSLTAFWAGSAGALIAGEAIMGAGGALIVPNSLAIVGHTFTDPRRRTEAISIWAGTSGLGLAIGPIVAGLLINTFSWHSVFLVNVGVAAIVLLASPALITDSRHPGRRLDPAGIVLGTVGAGALTYAIIEGGQRGFTSTASLVAGAVFAAALALFVVAELRNPDPMLQLRLFTSWSFNAVMSVGAVTLFALTGVSLLIVLYFQKVQHASALGAGWKFLPTWVAYIVASVLAGRLTARIGFKYALSLALGLSSLGTALLLLAPAGTGYAAIWPGLVAFGLGSGIALASASSAAIISVPHDQGGMASAAVNMLGRLGAVLGTSILGTVLTSQFASELPGKLQGAGLDSTTASQVQQSISHGQLPTTAGVGGAIQSAFTDSVHLGFLVAAVVLAVTIIPSLLLVKHRPER